LSSHLFPLHSSLFGRWTAKTRHGGPSAHCPVAGPWKGPMQYEADGGALMMLPTDMALIKDVAFKKHVEAYAADEELFFRDFAAAFLKLLENGCDLSKEAFV